MNETERAALVEELAEAIWSNDEGGYSYYDAAEMPQYRRMSTACLPIIDRLLATRTAPTVDELLDSVHPEATIDTLLNYDDGTWEVTIVHPITPTGSHGQSLIVKFVAYDGTGPTRMDAIRNAVAQAAGITPGDAREGE